MFSFVGLLVLLTSLGLLCAFYFIACTVRNTNRPLRGAYHMSDNRFSICAPGLFEMDRAQMDIWRCGELHQCVLQQDSALSCVSSTTDYPFNASTWGLHSAKSDSTSMSPVSVLCLLSGQEKQGRCVSSDGWNSSYTDDVSIPALYQCTMHGSEWLCQTTQNLHTNQVEVDYALPRTYLRADSGLDQRKLQQEPLADVPASIGQTLPVVTRRHSARPTRVDLYDHRESIRLLNMLLNGKCDSFRACPGQV